MLEMVSSEILTYKSNNYTMTDTESSSKLHSVIGGKKTKKKKQQKVLLFFFFFFSFVDESMSVAYSTL